MAPTILLDSLETVRRRVRWLSVFFGVGLLLAAAVGLLMGTVLVDYVLNLHAFPRLVLIAAAMGGVVYLLWHWVIQSILAKLTLGDVAGRIERAFPQYQDRLRSTIDIVTGKAMPGSEIMKQRVVSEATRLTQSLDLTRVVLARPVWYSTGAGMTACLVLALLLATMPTQYTRVAMDRLFTPFGDHPWPRIVSMDLVGNEPGRLSVGQRLDVNIRLTHGDRVSRKAIIYYQYGDEAGTHFGPVEQEYMTRGDDGVYHAAIDARTPGDASVGTMKVWSESGDGHLDLAPVRVVQRLTIARVEAVITAPPYANLPRVTVNLSQNPGLLTFGSKVTLTAEFNMPLDSEHPVSVEVLSAKAKPVFAWGAPVANSITASVDATESFRFHLHATDVDGLSNTAAEEFEFVIRPDQNPTVIIENPRRNEDRTPEATVPLQAVAEDDFGVDSLKLVVDRVGDKKHWEIPLVDAAAAVGGVQWNRVDAGGDIQRYRANYSWELSQLNDANLKSGDVLEYYALVKDNYELNGQTHAPVPSGKLRIVIISQEELTNKITDELSAVAEQTATIKQSQGTTHRQTSELAKEIAGKPQIDNADKVAADRLAGQQSTIASQTKSLANKLTEIQQRMTENKSNNQELEDTAKDVGNLLDSAAEHPMKNAAGDINHATQNADQADKKDDRNQALADAQTSQAKAGDDLQKALDRMGNIGSLSRSIEQVRSLLADQQKVSAETADAGKNNLGKTPDQFSPEDKKKLDDAAKEQADLSAKTAKVLDQMAKDAGKMAKSDPSASKAMSQAADTGQQQNVPGKQSKAADAAQQNQQGEAQSNQKQAELGLQMMLADLREAEKHKLDELAKKLAELQQQVAILIREQAGHNLDNLTLQNALSSLPAVVKLDLFTKAERDPQAAPSPVEQGMLNSGQEQTERNTRDIAKTAQDMPDGAGPADLLTRAADKMERAIVNLRDNKLTDAYNPAQVDALAALVEAKKLVDLQKAKADQKQEDQKKETIRQEYMALLAQQNEVNARTTAIDSTSKNDDGSLPREAAVRLGQLPGDQGKIADKAAKMDEDLSALGSIVYIWANQQIVKSMNDVKDSLGRQQIGAVTQAKQKQIADQLDAMIRDLATKPEKSKYAQQNGEGGGGGGGQQSSGMPSEAELRLIKDLQIAENTATTTISNQPAPDRSDLLSLGNRQGDLRNLLDKLLQKATQGKTKLPPEPDNRDQLPEETGNGAGKVAESVDNQELDQDLLGPGKAPKPDSPPAEAQKDLHLVGDRMARARQRLAMNADAGSVTQEIQKRILDNMDDLIEEARKKEAQGQNQPPKPGSKPQQQKPAKSDSGAQPQNAKADGQKPSPAQASAAGSKPGNGANGTPGDPAADIARQEAKMWGSPTPRQRDAIIESQGEKVLDKYQKLVDDYYRTLSTKAGAN